MCRDGRPVPESRRESSGWREEHSFEINIWPPVGSMGCLWGTNKETNSSGLRPVHKRCTRPYKAFLISYYQIFGVYLHLPAKNRPLEETGRDHVTINHSLLFLRVILDKAKSKIIIHYWILLYRMDVIYNVANKHFIHQRTLKIHITLFTKIL